MEMTLPALIHYTHTLALTSEHRSEQSGDDTASINREVKEREKSSQEVLLELRGHVYVCVCVGRKRGWNIIWE